MPAPAKLRDVHEHLSNALIALSDANEHTAGGWPDELLEVARLLTNAQSTLLKYGRRSSEFTQPPSHSRPD
jgi:hypothetical protein